MTNKQLKRGTEIIADATALTRSIEKLEQSPTCKISFTLKDGEVLTIFARDGGDLPELAKCLVDEWHQTVLAEMKLERKELQEEFEKL